MIDHELGSRIYVLYSISRSQSRPSSTPTLSYTSLTPSILDSYLCRNSSIFVTVSPSFVPLLDCTNDMP